MGLEKLKSSLIADANAEAERIVSSAQKEAKAILDSDIRSAEETKKQLEKNLDLVLSTQREERMAALRLETKRLLSEAKEDVLASAFDDFFAALKDLKKSSEYKKLLLHYLDIAKDELKGDIIVHVSKGDKDLIPKTKNTLVKEDLEGVGGILIENADGKIRLNYTFETLFEKEKDTLRKKLYEIFFRGTK